MIIRTLFLNRNIITLAEIRVKNMNYYSLDNYHMLSKRNIYSRAGGLFIYVTDYYEGSTIAIDYVNDDI